MKSRKEHPTDDTGHARGFLAILSLLLAGMFVALYFYLTQKPPAPDPQAESGAPPGKTSPGAGRTNSWLQRGSIGNPTSDPTGDTQGENDPEMAKKQAKHHAIQGFLHSPARDTTECREILQLLTSHGFGIEQLELAYNAAWEVRRRDPNLTRPQITTFDGRKTDASSPQIQAMLIQAQQQTIEQQIQILQRKGKMTDNELLGQLLLMRPKILYGQWPRGDLSRVKEKDLLTDQHLADYLETNPIKDVSWEQADAINASYRPPTSATATPR